MPNYKTHSIHGELLFSLIDKRIFISKEYLKTYCFGFDTLIFSDYALFEKQHKENTKLYFETLLKSIKQNRLQDNSETMAYLYGQIDHFVLDMTIHPLIYYMTENMPKKHILDNHALVEHEIDNYVQNKYNIQDEVYQKWEVNDPKLRNLINHIYMLAYQKSKMVLKYDLGIKSINVYDNLARRNALKVTPIICFIFNIGDITYHKNNKNKKYLNLKHKPWLNPETGKISCDSFDDLWNKSLDLSLETIDNINHYLYDDKNLNIDIIENDLSLNTGLPCKEGQNFTYTKKY